MSTLAWTDIPAGDVDGLSSVYEDLLADFWSNQLCLISELIPCPWAQVTATTGAFVQKVQKPIFIPPACETNEKAVTLLLVFEAYNENAGAVGRLRARIGPSGTWVETGDITLQAATRFTLSIPAADVNAAAGTEIDLFIEMKRVSGTGEIRSRNQWDITRLEVAP